MLRCCVFKKDKTKGALFDNCGIEAVFMVNGFSLCDSHIDDLRSNRLLLCHNAFTNVVYLEEV